MAVKSDTGKKKAQPPLTVLQEDKNENRCQQNYISQLPLKQRESFNRKKATVLRGFTRNKLKIGQVERGKKYSIYSTRLNY